MRGLALLGATLASIAAAEPASGLFCPLEVQPHPKLAPSTETLQKRFFSAARDSSGLNLALRLEAENVIASSGLTDYRTNDAALAQLAQRGKVLYAGTATLSWSAKNELVLSAHVVRDDGESVARAEVRVPRGKKPLSDAVIDLTEQLFTKLNTAALPATPPEPKPMPVVFELKQAEPKPAPPVVEAPPPVATPRPVVAAPVVSAPIERATASPPKTPGPLRSVGFLLAGAGAGVGLGGALLFATAGAVRRDEFGNVFYADANRVADIRTRQELGLGVLIGGGVAAGAGLVMALLFTDPSPASVAVVPVADGAVVSLGGTF